jgi:hypothetical protein
MRSLAMQLFADPKNRIDDGHRVVQPEAPARIAAARATFILVRYRMQHGLTRPIDALGLVSTGARREFAACAPRHSCPVSFRHRTAHDDVVNLDWRAYRLRSDLHLSIAAARRCHSVRPRLRHRSGSSFVATLAPAIC